MEARAISEVPAIERISRPAAQQGTLGHDVIAQTLALIYHGPTGWRDPGEIVAMQDAMMLRLEPWAKDAVRRCVSYAVALVDAESKRHPIKPTVEIEMKLSGGLINVKRGGTADLVIIGNDKVIIADWKLGFLDQGEAADHVQLSAYAVMAWDKYFAMRRKDNSACTIEIHLAQGRLREFSAATFDKQDIESARAKIKHIVEKCISSDAQIVPSITACRYCKAITQCRILRERIMRAQDELAMFGASPEDRVRLAEDAALARRFSEDAKELAKVWQADAQNQQSKDTP
jgi:hypothetical protein